MGLGTADIAQGVATSWQAEDCQASTQSVNLGEIEACQDNIEMVVGTAEQEIEQGVATSGQAKDSPIATQKERVWHAKRVM